MSNKYKSLYDKEIDATIEYMIHHSENQQEAANKQLNGETVIPIDNSKFPFEYKREDLPLDKDGYCISFSIDEEEEYKQFFDRYGVVVVSGILTEEECIKTEDEIWEFITRHTDNNVLRDKPETWEYWPRLKQLGILGNEFILSPQCCENRQNPKLANVFKVILESNDVMVNIGRASAMRATKDLNINGTLVDKPEWKTIPKWLHLDMNPWTGLTTTFSFRNRNSSLNRGYDIIKVQGILSCVDCGPNDGGFQCVPGFQKHIRGWAHKNMKYFNKKDFDVAGSIQIPKSDPIWNDIQKVPIKKGSIVIWNSCLPHGTFPNNSNHGRMIQYIKMARKDDPSIEPIFKNESLLPDNFKLTSLGRELIGLDD